MFRDDLKEGEENELYAASVINPFLGVNLKKNPNSKGTDLIDKEMIVEVKFDRKRKTTGNVAIETKCYGKPSGISTTTGTHWCFVIGKDVYLSTVKEIREWLKEHHGEYRMVMGGYWKASLMALINKKQFNQLFIKIPNQQK